MCLSVLQKDDATFERHFSQLKPLYTDVRCVHSQKETLGLLPRRDRGTQR